MTRLPPYSGPADCPKCASYMRTDWHGSKGSRIGMGNRKPLCEDDPGVPHVRGEHLCRSCPRCGYGWCEACKDDADTVPQASAPDEERLLWGSSARR